MSKEEYNICDDCGDQKEDVVYTICTFDSDINGIATECTLCQKCYNGRVMDI